MKPLFNFLTVMLVASMAQAQIKGEPTDDDALTGGLSPINYSSGYTPDAQDTSTDADYAGDSSLYACGAAAKAWMTDNQNNQNQFGPSANSFEEVFRFIKDKVHYGNALHRNRPWVDSIAWTTKGSGINMEKYTFDNNTGKEGYPVHTVRITMNVDEDCKVTSAEVATTLVIE